MIIGQNHAKFVISLEKNICSLWLSLLSHNKPNSHNFLFFIPGHVISFSYDYGVIIVIFHHRDAAKIRHLELLI